MNSRFHVSDSVKSISFILVYFLVCIALPNNVVTAEPIAIIGAFDTELELVRSRITEPDTHRILGIEFCRGTLNETSIVFAEVGVAKVNAAMTTILLIEHFRPSAIIFTGIAGAVGDSILPGDIVIGRQTAHHDLVSISDEEIRNFGVVNPVNGIRNPVLFPASEQLLESAWRAAGEIELESMTTTVGDRTPRVVEGIIATGDAFVASAELKADIRSRLDAVAVEMEGAAVAQVCYQHGIPCIVIRSISDNADANAGVDFERFYRIAARNSAQLVMSMIKHIQ